MKYAGTVLHGGMLGLFENLFAGRFERTARDSMPGAAVPRLELKLTKMWAAFSATVGTNSEAESVLYTARSTAPPIHRIVAISVAICLDHGFEKHPADCT